MAILLLSSDVHSYAITEWLGHLTPIGAIRWTSQNRPASGPTDRRRLIAELHHQICVRAKFARRFTSVSLFCQSRPTRSFRRREWATSAAQRPSDQTEILLSHGSDDPGDRNSDRARIARYSCQHMLRDGKRRVRYTGEVQDAATR